MSALNVIVTSSVMSASPCRQESARSARRCRLGRPPRSVPPRLGRDAVDAFQDFMRGRRLAPIGKEIRHVKKCHLIDLGRRIAAGGHQAGVDQAEIESAPACPSPDSVSAFSLAMKPARRRTARIAAAISVAVASISPSLAAACG